MTDRAFFSSVGARLRLVVLAGAVAASLASSGALAAEPVKDHGVDHPMRVDPVLPPIPLVPNFHPDLKRLWFAAMDRPEASIRIKALHSIPVVKRVGMTDAEQFAPKVLQLLRDDKQPPAIHLAAVQALVALDAKESAGDLLEKSRAGNMEIVLAVDEALAKWKAAGAKELWINRVKDGATAEQVARSAMRSLGTLGAADAAEPLRVIITDTARGLGTRVAAAEAFATLAPANAAEFAGPLANSNQMEERIVGATMLPANTDAKVVPMLVKLSQDPEAGVASVAVGKLMQSSPDSLAPLVDKLANHSDAIIRRHSVAVLQRHPEAKNITTIARLMGDLAPKVRAAAREALIALDGQAGLKELVRPAALEHLNKGNWRAIEQAALVLGTLDEESARDRYVELLRHEQWQVRTAAIVALRRVKIADTLPLEFRRAQELADEYTRQTEIKTKDRLPMDAFGMMDRELAQLFQNLGLAKLQACDGFARKFIPKNSYGEKARVAAIWTLGHLHADKSDPEVARGLTGRIQDNDPLNPESGDVRIMSAVSLARMRDKSAKSVFGGLIKDPANAMLRESAIWGMSYLDGKPYPGPEASQKAIPAWFLEPLP
jgi:HEAT repeat protein